MTVIVTKDAINLREKLSELDKETGIKGEELMRADTSAEAREALQLDQQLFTDFESTGIDDNATSTAMTLNASGNVGIGISPDSNSKLHVANFTASIDQYTVHIEGYQPSVVWQDVSGGPSTDFEMQADGSALMFRYGDATTGTQLTSEAMRIDSSGNVLVGTTSVPSTLATTGSVEGFGFDGASDYLALSRASGTPLILNRLTTYGDIISFRRNGTVEGSIGSRSSGLFLAKNNTNIVIYDDNTTNAIFPEVGSDPTDLGITAARFRNLYLSSGVYLGGTAAANKLDDYEEGLWTPVYQSASGSFTTMTMYNNLTNKPRYTKIGNLVTVSGYIDTFSVVVGTASGDLLIDGLPFEALISASGSVSVTGLWAGDNPLSVSVTYQSTSLRIQYRTSVNGDDIDMNVTDLTTGTGLASGSNGMAFTITYTTAE